MIELITMYIGRIIANYIGATVRWTYGTIWRTIFKKPKFTYSEYVNGPNDSTDSFDEVGHRFNNKIVGMITIAFIAGVIISMT